MDPGFQSLIKLTFAGFNALVTAASIRSEQHLREYSSLVLGHPKMDGALSRDFEGSMDHITSRSN